VSRFVLIAQKWDQHPVKFISRNSQISDGRVWTWCLGSAKLHRGNSAVPSG
jgi:hypothetical protein